MFEQVKQEIDDKIKTNGNNEITATRLNGVLQDMMDAAAEEIEDVAQSVGDQVEANPAGEATTHLKTIKIGETTYKTGNPFAGEVGATDSERLQALANVSNQEAGYDSSDPLVFTGKMGYVVLQPEKAGDTATSFAAQIANKPNTIFEIRDVFDLGGTQETPVSVTLPAGSTLKFNGGIIKNGTISGNDTKIESDILEIFRNCSIIGNFRVDKFYPEWFGAKGDGTTDDTSAFEKLNGRTIQLSNKTYRISNVIYSQGTAIIGTSIAKSILKQCDNSTGTMILLKDFNGGELYNFSIEGGNGFIESQTSYKIGGEVCSDALIKLVGTQYQGEGIGLNYFVSINNIRVYNAPCNGIVCFGRNVTEDGYTTSYNWVFKISNCWIMHCKYYGILNSSSDNSFSNIYISHCGYANIYENGSSNTWNNVKADGVSGAGLNQELIDTNDVESSVASLFNDLYKGAIVIAKNVSNVKMTDFDIQSSAVTGIKIIGSDTNFVIHSNFSGSINNCGASTKIQSIAIRKKYCPGVYIQRTILSNIDFITYKHTKQESALQIDNNLYIYGNTIKIWNDDYDYSEINDFENSLVKLSSNNDVYGADICLTKKSQKSIMRNLLEEDVHKLKSGITTTGTVITENTIFNGYNDVTLDYSNNKTFYTAYKNIGKKGHVYLGIAIIKVNRASTGDSSNYSNLPYISLNGRVGSTQISPSLSNRNYKTSYQIVGDKYIISQIVNFNSSVDYEIQFQIGKGSACDGSYNVTNLSIYDLSESIGIYGINNMLSNTNFIVNLIGINNFENINTPINNFYTDFVSEYSKSNEDDFGKSGDKQMPNPLQIGKSYYDLELHKKLIISSQIGDVLFTKEISNETIFIANTLDNYCYISVSNAAYYTSSIKFSTTNDDSTAITTGSISIGANINNRLIKVPDKEQYPYIRLQTNKTTSVVFTFNGIATKWTDEQGFTPALSKGKTASRPTNLTADDFGFEYADSDLGKKIMWSGTSWVNLDGTALS